MIACLDVDYRETDAVAACVLFQNWEDDRPASEWTERVSPIEPYVPGSFYLRELPCLLSALTRAPSPSTPRAIVIDGYVWLDERQSQPGLGKRLYEALGEQAPVIGVAKTRFQGASAVEAHRGESRRPLYVSAVGITPEIAAGHVRSMSGPHRIPALLKRVDQLCRSARGERSS